MEAEIAKDGLHGEHARQPVPNCSSNYFNDTNVPSASPAISALPFQARVTMSCGSCCWAFEGVIGGEKLQVPPQ